MQLLNRCPSFGHVNFTVVVQVKVYFLLYIHISTSDYFTYRPRLKGSVDWFSSDVSSSRFLLLVLLYTPDNLSFIIAGSLVYMTGLLYKVNIFLVSTSFS